MSEKDYSTWFQELGNSIRTLTDKIDAVDGKVDAVDDKVNNIHNRLFVDPEKGFCMSTQIKKNTESIGNIEKKTLIKETSSIDG